MRVLVTGGSGFVGRYLIRSALERGHEVTATYRTSTEQVLVRPSLEGVHWERLDMQDRARVEEVVVATRAEAVFHLAGQAYAQKAWADPADTFRTNVLGTIYLYEALRATRPSAGVVIAASSSAYGSPKQIPISENSALNPTNPYGVSKACQDMLSLQYSLNYGTRILRARLFGTTGPGKVGDVVNDIARQVARIEKTGKAGQVKVGNLNTLRDVSDVRDAIRALWRLLDVGDPTAPVNVAAGRSYSIRYIAERLVQSARVPVDLIDEPSLKRPTDDPDNRADVSRLRALGVLPEFPLEQSILDALDYWRTLTD